MVVSLTVTVFCGVTFFISDYTFQKTIIVNKLEEEAMISLHT